MNLTSVKTQLSWVKTVKQILEEHQVKPSRGLGQNFLIDSRAVQKLLAAAQVGKEDTVLEIGPGIGTLTQELARRAKHVVAVEKDAKMVEILKETLSGFPNVEVVHGDALKTDYTRYPSINSGQANYKVVANLPYHITAPVIRKFLELREAGPSTMTLIVQKEVAQRICGKPPEMSILAVSVQVYATPKIVSHIKRTSFWPQPMVDASILQITPLAEPYTQDFHRFFTIVKAGFKQPRKQLVNNLSKEFARSRQKTEQWLLSNNIQPIRRAETLTVQDWINLTNTLQ